MCNWREDIESEGEGDLKIFRAKLLNLMALFMIIHVPNDLRRILSKENSIVLHLQASPVLMGGVWYAVELLFGKS